METDFRLMVEGGWGATIRGCRTKSGTESVREAENGGGGASREEKARGKDTNEASGKKQAGWLEGRLGGDEPAKGCLSSVH